MTVKEFLDNCSDRAVVRLWNTYCIINGYKDSICYPMYKFEEIIDTDKLSFRNLFKQLDANFTFNHPIFWFDILYHIVSGHYSDFINAVVNLNCLAKAIEENPNDYGIHLED